MVLSLSSPLHVRCGGLWCNSARRFPIELKEEHAYGKRKDMYTFPANFSSGGNNIVLVIVEPRR